MTLIEAIILGIIQGATEFLPVSSSGHSILVPPLLGLGDPGLTAVIIAHQGTLLAVLIYFWRDVVAIVRGVLRGLAERAPLGNPEARLGWLLVLGCIPAAVIGLLFEDSFERVFSDTRWAAGFLLVTALLLVLGERMVSGRKTISGIGPVDAILIGLFQMFALFPGVSRSGSTIVGGLSRGLGREEAARFSFLLSIPVVAGAGLLSLRGLFSADAESLLALLVTFVVSLLVGLGSIHFLMQWLRTRKLYPFAIYCAAFGIFSLLRY
jgi:undecaprenyl-diphosphatase